MSTHHQEPLWIESIEEAAQEIARRFKGGPKQLAHKLEPNKSAEAAHRWFLDCCNTERDRDFKPEHIRTLIKIGREIGCHHLMYFLCDECGYERPAVKEPEDELKTLLAAYLERRRVDARDEAKIDSIIEKVYGIGAQARRA